MKTNKSILLAGFLGALTVAMGAFGAHLLKAHLEAVYLANYQTGILYQFIHVIAIFGAGIWLQMHPNRNLKFAVTFWLIGILLFSGSLYAMAFASMAGTQFSFLGPVTPLGGLSFITGWIFLALAAVRK